VGFCLAQPNLQISAGAVFGDCPDTGYMRQAVFVITFDARS